VHVIRHFLNPPNWFTSASLFCSTYAMASVLAAGSDPSPEVMARACVLVIWGGVFDLLDGRVARAMNRYSDFGVQLDSIADVVGFGLAPALLAWVWKLQDLGAVGFAATFAYVLCAAFRLARFNVAASNDSWPLHGHTQGLTTTMAGGILVTLLWVSNGYLLDWLVIPAWALALFTFSLGMLMISSIPFRSFKDLRNNRTARRFAAVFLACCLFGALTLDHSMWWGVGGALYLSVGLVDGIVTAIWHRRLSQALLLDELESVLDDPSDEVEASADA
jgi:CDP-diacylglycerol--serine O-phosphatidyltransferase